jgi:hypothetical protein
VLPERASRPTAITGVQVGAAEGMESSGTGILLFDDLTID